MPVTGGIKRKIKRKAGKKRKFPPSRADVRNSEL
jgi:hypothetical protein